jgi:hypothetical protein
MCKIYKVFLGKMEAIAVILKTAQLFGESEKQVYSSWLKSM